MRTVSDAAKEVLRLFHYGPHFTPEQNRALASLNAAVENEMTWTARQDKQEHPPGSRQVATQGTSELTEEGEEVTVGIQWTT